MVFVLLFKELSLRQMIGWLVDHCTVSFRLYNIWFDGWTCHPHSSFATTYIFFSCSIKIVTWFRMIKGLNKSIIWISLKNFIYLTNIYIFTVLVKLTNSSAGELWFWLVFVYQYFYQNFYPTEGASALF